MLCCGKCTVVFDFSSSNVIRLVSCQCYLITPYLINQQCAHCNLPNLHFPINFYALSSSLHFSLLLSPHSFDLGVFCLVPHPFPPPASFWCAFDVCGVVRWQPAAATHSSPLWRRSQGRRAPTARSPLPLPAAPPPRGLTLTLLLTRYCKPHPGHLWKLSSITSSAPPSILPLSNLHITPEIHGVT